jgi:hypothetical protein
MMNQYIHNLLTLVLTATCALTITPSQAQTPIESNSEESSSKTPPVIDTNEISKVGDSVNSTNSKPIVSSQATSNTSATTKSDLRTPIFSRIFVVPSMQQ